MQWRPVVRTTRGIQTSDGAGVRLRRLMGGGSGLPSIDPFLMLDFFDSPRAQDYIAGFPEHPHRGFETVTYKLAGRMRHRDNKGGRRRAGEGIGDCRPSAEGARGVARPVRDELDRRTDAGDRGLPGRSVLTGAAGITGQAE